MSDPLPFPARLPLGAAARLLYLRRVVGTFFAAAGVERATAWASTLARWLFDLNIPARSRVESNLGGAFVGGGSAAERERLARAVFDNIASFWIEALYAPRLLRRGSWDRFVRHGTEWQTLVESSRPALLVTSYTGNPAVGTYALGQLFRPVHVLIDAVQFPVLNGWQRDLYRQPNVRLVPRERAVRELPAILESGGKVVVLGEHARRRGASVDVPFLGTMLRCYPTIGVLAARYGADVAVFTCDRVPRERFRFELRCHAVVDTSTQVQTEDHGAITVQCMRELERAILARPEQYLWTRGWVGS